MSNNNYKVHVGFGFHVNCYHSYRGDTNDAFGFGNDIRIIRHIIDTLDSWNARGVAAKGTWDFENAYSLEKILPEYAPDIIENVARRQRENGDENILMGYNNGAMSAMNEEEFIASIEWAISNDKKSGLKDVFGDCAMVIRPQEVMFTPTQVSLYKKLGVEAICLYYSCVPFDAFRTLIPQLDSGHAYNPITYSYDGEEITIMPTYSQSDIMDVGSLRLLVSELHVKQVSGEINRDVFVFINMDADSFLWDSMGLPEFLSKQPNMDGLNGYINEIYDLDFVCFDTVGNYLKNHSPSKVVSFGHDVADGNFNGYSSWAEKPFNRQIWTRLEKTRLIADVAGNSDSSFEKRIRLLSTTHFGLASPVLNITREKTALSLSKEMLEEELELLDKGNELYLKSSSLRKVFATQLSVRKGYCDNVSKMSIVCDDLKSYCVIPMSYYEDGSVKSIYLICIFNKEIDSCKVVVELTSNGVTSDSMGEFSDLDVKTNANGYPVIMHGDDILCEFESYINYGNKKYRFDVPKSSALGVAGSGVGIRYSGEIHLPNEVREGYYHFDFIKVEGISSLLFISEVQYPYTKEEDQISSQASNLGRYTDNQWVECVPMAFSLKFKEDAVVSKRNFFGKYSKYALSDFWKSMIGNHSLDSFNHQLTGGILCVSNDLGGIAIAHSRAVLGSMAHCPMRLVSEGTMRKVLINSFGTFFGKQRAYPSYRNGCVMELYNATMPQAQSLAPSYNGVCERSVQSIAFVRNELSEELRNELEAISDGVVAIGGSDVTYFVEDNVSFCELQHSSSSNSKTRLSKTPMYAKGRALVGSWHLIQTILRAKKKLKSYKW